MREYGERSVAELRDWKSAGVCCDCAGLTVPVIGAGVVQEACEDDAGLAEVCATLSQATNLCREKVGLSRCVEIMATEFVMDQCCDLEELQQTEMSCALLTGPNSLDENCYNGDEARFFFEFGMEARDLDVREKCMELNRKHPGLVGYLFELLNRGPVFVFLPEDFIKFAENNEEHYCGDDYDCMTASQPEMDMHYQTLDRYVPKYARSGDKPKEIPEEWRDLIGRYEEALETYGMMSAVEKQFKCYEDVPYVFLKWGKRSEWERLQDDLLQWSSETGEGQMSPFEVFLRGEAAETGKILRGMFQMAECQLEIIRMISSER